MMPDKDSIREPVTMETLDDLCSESSMDSSEAGGAVHSERGDDQQEGAHRPMTPTGIYAKKKKKRKHYLDTVVVVNDPTDDFLTYHNEELQTTFRVGETVYIQSKKGEQLHSVCTILGFQTNTKNHLLVHVKFYYRATEVPDSVYLPLIHDRNIETKSGGNLAIKDPVVRTRELFRSEVTDTFPVCVLRGKCRVIHFEDISKVEEFKPVPDTFFYIFEYSPTTKRLATIQGEIRVGPSHQAKLPEWQAHKKPADMVERPEDWEEVTWKPTAVLDGDLVMYLRAARSMAAFAGMCDGGSTEDALTAASMDETTIKALDELHNCGYDTKRALGDLVKRINPKSYEKRWSEEDVKKFVKGLRIYGKSFFKIRKELLPDKETGELVEYYYYWKKTPAATTSRPHTRRRRGRKQARTPTRQTSEECDASSASELSEGEDSEYSDTSSSRDNGYYCSNCDTTRSKDWHYSGKKEEIHCTDCRLYFEEHRKDRPLIKPKDTPHYLFQPVKEKRNLPSPESERKSPSSDSVSSLSSSDNNNPPDRQTNKQKRVGDSDEGGEKGVKRAKPSVRCDSPSESYISDSSSVYNDNEENGNEGDVETNQDDATSTDSSSPTEEVVQKQPPATPPYLNGIPRPIPKPAQAVPHPPGSPAGHLRPMQSPGNTPAGAQVKLQSPTGGFAQLLRPVMPRHLNPALHPQLIASHQHKPGASKHEVQLKASGSSHPETTSTTNINSMAQGHSITDAQKLPPSSSQTSTLLASSGHLIQPSYTAQLNSISSSAPQPGVFTPSVSMTNPSSHHQYSLVKQEPKSEPQSEGTEDSESSSDKSSESEHSAERESTSIDGNDKTDKQDVPPVSSKGQDLVPASYVAKPIKQEPMDSLNYGSSMPANPYSGRFSYPSGVLPPHHAVKQEPKDAGYPMSSYPGNFTQSSNKSSQGQRTPPPLPISSTSTASPSSSSTAVSQQLPPKTASSATSTSVSQADAQHLQKPPSAHHQLPPHLPPSHIPPHLNKLPPTSSALPLQVPQIPHPHHHHHHPSHQHPSARHHQSHPATSRPLAPGGGGSGNPTLPQPPPLVSLPQTSIPTTQPPALVASASSSVSTGQSTISTIPPPSSCGQPPPRGLPPGMSSQPIVKQEMESISNSSRPRSPPKARSPQRDHHPSSLQGGSSGNSNHPQSSRERSRSPLMRPETPESDPEPARSPEPEARIVNEPCHKSKNAIFIKHWYRGWNSCSRCDFEFRPLPDSKLAKKREDQKLRRLSSSSSSGHMTSSGRDDRREEIRKEEDRTAKKPETPPENSTADAQITSAVLHSPHIGGPYASRLSPRPPFPVSMGGDRTPALTQLSVYARHNLAGPGHEPRPLPYGLHPPPHTVDPYHLYHPGSREHLEIELEREKRERDARERELRERELRELELREKIKNEIEMKPPGFERPPNHMDLYLAEALKRLPTAGHMPQALPAGLPHHSLPGMHPQVSLAAEIIGRERERLERHGIPAAHLPDHVIAERLAAERLQAERLSALTAATDPLLRLQTPGGNPHPHPHAPPHLAGSQHTHTHSHTHLHLHQPEVPNVLAGSLPALPPHLPLGHEGLPGSLPSGATPGPSLPPHDPSLPPGPHQVLEAAARQSAAASELLYRDLLSRQQYSDPVLAHQLQQEALHQEARRQMLERERMAGHPSHPPPHLR